MKIFKKTLLTLLTMSTAACLCLAACDNGNGGDNGTEHTHEWVLKHDDTNHWYECEADGEKKDSAPHTDAKNNAANTAGADGKCDVCGAEVPLPGSQANPIVIGDEEIHYAEVQAGQTLHYRLSFPAAPEGKYYRAYSPDETAILKSGANTGSDIRLVMTGIRYTFTLTTADGAAGRVCFGVELAEESAPGETPTNPLYYIENEPVNIADGATVYMRFRTRIAPDESEYFVVTSDNANAVFTVGESSGAEVRLVVNDDGFSYDFALTMKDGKAATVKVSVDMHGAPGTANDPYEAVLGENSCRFTAVNQTVFHKYTAAQTGFYVVTSACRSLTAFGGAGLEDGLFEDFKIIYYVKQGASITLSMTLSEEFEGVAADVKFDIAPDNGHGSGTETDPYKLNVGDICSFAVSGEDKVFVKVVDGSGNGVAAVLNSPNSSAYFADKSYRLALTGELIGGAVSVGAGEYGTTNSVFVVGEPE